MESARPQIEQQVTFIYASEPARSWAFYGDLLGLELVLDQGACRIYCAAGDAFLGICRKGKQQPAPAGVILTLVTQEVDAWYRYLQAKGAALEAPPKLNEAYDIYHFFAHDPGGYLVEFQSFRDPTWPTPRGRSA